MTEPRILYVDIAPSDAAEVRRMRQAARDGTVYQMTYEAGYAGDDVASLPVTVTRVRKQYRWPVVRVTMTEYREAES